MDSEGTCVSNESPLALRSRTKELCCGVIPTTAPFQREQNIDRIQLWPVPKNGVPSGQKMMQRAASLRVNQTGLWNPVLQTPYRFFKSSGLRGEGPAERHLWRKGFDLTHKGHPVASRISGRATCFCPPGRSNLPGGICHAVPAISGPPRNPLPEDVRDCPGMLSGEHTGFSERPGQCPDEHTKGWR